MQKPPFCTPKTILLKCKNHTFAWRICNTQITNTLRTLRECILNGLRMRGEHTEISTKHTVKCATNNPPGVGADSSRPYPNITKYAYSRHQIRVSVSPHTHIHIINYVFLHYRIRVFTSSNTHIHFIANVHSSPILWVFSYTRAR